VNSPTPQSYWVKPGQLAAGEYPGAPSQDEAAAKLARAQASGVTSFVDLTEDGELEPYSILIGGLRWVRLPIRDGGVPDDREMRAILDRIDSEVAHGETVYLHCWGGHGRTGTVVGCWLVRHGIDSDLALARIEELRHETPDASWPSPEFPHQQDLVTEWLTRDPEALLVHSLHAAAPRLEERALDHHLGETRDLHPEMVAALRELVGDRVYPNRRINFPEWNNVGGVDLTVSAEPAESGLLLAAEEKWGKLDEEVWDLFKMALITTHGNVDGAFLVSGVSATQLESGFCADILDTGRHSTLELCRRRYASGGRRFVWDWMLEGGYDDSPARVPAEIDTRLVVRAPVEAAAAEVRVVRVSVSEGGEPVSFIGGWPNGERPAEARRPAVSGDDAVSETPV
jgi:hypothetical protein